MKKILLSLIAGTMLWSACKTGSTGTYNITGEITGLKDSVLYLAQQDNETPHFDTIPVKNGKFTFSGKAPAKAVLAQIITADQTGGFPLFLEGGNIQVKGVADSLPYGKVDVTGTPSNEDLHTFMEMQMPFVKEMMSLQSDYMKASSSGDTAQLAMIQQRNDSLQQVMMNAVKGFIQSHPKSLVSGMALQSMLNSADPDELQQMYSSLDTSIQHSEFVKPVADKLEAAKKTSIGQMAPDFTQNDPDGKAVSLSDFKGKYVLVDFWASWCGPCRAENPNVVKAYNQYKDKNFTILSVSLDQKKEDWLKAIKDDHLTWNHVSDLKYWENTAAQEYGVQAIPANFLVDPQGKIIARDLRGDDLESKLAEVLK